jgi:hypothetical protein
MDIEEQKQLFATLLLKWPDEPMRAAMQIAGEADVARAAWIANKWPLDPVVMMMIDEARESGADLAALPTKADLARKVFALADTAGTMRAFSEAERLYKLYAEVRGFVEKPAAPSATVNIQHNRVMMVRDCGTDADWESRTASQQKALIDVASGPAH